MTLSPEQTKAALDELVQSDGWVLVKQMAAEQYGSDAQLAEIDAVFRASPPSDIADVQGVVVPQIRAGAKAVLNLIASVENRQRVMGAPVTPKVEARFAPFRRTGAR